jgi:hypothetical protein
VKRDQKIKNKLYNEYLKLNQRKKIKTTKVAINDKMTHLFSYNKKKHAIYIILFEQHKKMI